MKLAYCLQHPLTERDAIEVLGAVYFYLRHHDTCRTMRDYTANCLAQGTILVLRTELMESAYSRESLTREFGGAA